MISFDEAMGPIAPDATLPEVTLDPEDDATIFYTSGTTGSPKGALGSHRNICGNLMSLAFANARAGLRSALRPELAANAAVRTSGRNVYLLSVPFFHATGCHSILVANLAVGAKIVIMHKWDAGRALELIEQERVTTFGGVPAMVWQVLEHPDFERRDLTSVKSIGYGGAPAAPELVRRIEAMFPGRTPSNGYGLTETSSVTTMNIGIDYLRKPDSVGVPVPVCDVKVVDLEGNDLPSGSVGELWIKGPNVVTGLLEQARGDRGELQRRLVALRRCRPDRRRGLRLHRRPRQGHDHPRRRERVLRRGRSGTVRAPRRHRRRRDRHPASRSSARRSGRSSTSLLARAPRSRSCASGSQPESPRSRCR